MKKVFWLTIVLAGLAMIIVAADFRAIPVLQVEKPLPKKHCVGFTIIEYDKGIDCHGDTVKLHRKNGFASLAEV